MSKTNAMEINMLRHYFMNDDHAAIGDAAGLQNSAAAGSLYVSLHIGDPGEAGDQTTSEANYTSYARVAVARSVTGWTENGSNGIENTSVVTFPQATGGSSTCTHFGVGTDSSGAGNLLYFAALTASLAVTNGVTPKFAAGDLDVTED